MGRVFKVNTLLSAEREQVEDVLRQYQYGQFGQASAALKELGLNISRSALHRYSKVLIQRDQQSAGQENVTVAVLIDRATGQTVMMLTPDPIGKVQAAIKALATQKTKPQDL